MHYGEFMGEFWILRGSMVGMELMIVSREQTNALPP